MTYRTAAQIIEAADWQCRDSYRAPASDESSIDSALMTLDYLIKSGQIERARALWNEIKPFVSK